MMVGGDGCCCCSLCYCCIYVERVQKRLRCSPFALCSLYIRIYVCMIVCGYNTKFNTNKWTHTYVNVRIDTHTLKSRWMFISHDYTACIKDRMGSLPTCIICNVCNTQHTHRIYWQSQMNDHLCWKKYNENTTKCCAFDTFISSCSQRINCSALYFSLSLYLAPSLTVRIFLALLIWIWCFIS